MAILKILNTGKDIRRINQLTAILLRHGLSDLIRRGGLSQLMEQVKVPVSKEMLEMNPAVRVRRALEEMGPTFIKFGQIMATRVDLFPIEWLEEFEKLQDNTTALDFEELRPKLEESLGKPVGQVFNDIDLVPLGSASLAQVHCATLENGDKVALKILKPGTRAIIESDLRLIHYIARLVAVQSEEMRRYHPEALVKEFERSLHRELDFEAEANNMERSAKNLRKMHFVTIPKVYREWSSRDLLVQEYINGISAKDVEAIDSAGMDRELIARRGAQIVWKTIFEDGFFHADPHPGNFYILPDNRIAMLDFGMVGKLSEARREQLIKMIRSFVFQDLDGAASVLREWSGNRHLNMEALTSELGDLLDQYYGASIKDIDFTQVILDETKLMHNHDIQVPADIALFSKALLTLEGFARLIYPDFDIMSEAEPLVRKAVMDRYKPTRLVKSLGQRAVNMLDQAYQPPTEQNTSEYQQMQLLHEMEEQVVEGLGSKIEDASHRQTKALYDIAYLLIYTLMLMVDKGPQLWDESIFFWIGVVGIFFITANVCRNQVIMWWQKKTRGL